MVSLAGLLILVQTDVSDAGERLSLLTKLIAFSVVALAFLVLALWLLHRMFRQWRAQTAAAASAALRAGKSEESAFAMATFQGVIQRLREQEKELERLHRAERQRALESEQLSATIMRNMATGLIILNARGLITESNPAAKAVLGHELLVGRGFRDVFWPESAESEPPPPIVENMESCLRTGQTFRRNTFTYHAPNGETKVLGVGLSPILADGQVGGVICLLSDLTEITALQHEIQLKENLAALGEMSAGIAHEFKNSLATISGYAQLIRGEDKLEGAQQHAAKIITETQFLTQVVTDFLNFSRPLNLVACDVSTRELIETTFDEVVSRGDFPEVKLELSGQFPVISADQTLLRQCFANLLRNSCEAISETGCGRCVAVEGNIEAGESGPVLRLRFADDGPGIPPENLDKVFIPFFTTKNAGTGLGLALVHKIVVNHSGKIQVSSEAGSGTTFTVMLPLGTASGTAATAFA